MLSARIVVIDLRRRTQGLLQFPRLSVLVHHPAEHVVPMLVYFHQYRGGDSLLKVPRTKLRHCNLIEHFIPQLRDANELRRAQGIM